MIRMRYCPHCHKPMLLGKKTQGRVYDCSPCDFVSAPLDPHLPLSIEAITEDMQLRYVIDASQEAARQAGCRRLSAQLEALSVGQQYLSQAEIDQLHESARILDKIASAAELARQSKHQQQLAAEQNQQLSYQQALAELDYRDRYEADNVIELVRHVLTQSELRGDVLPVLDVDWINGIMDQAPRFGSIVVFLQQLLNRLIQQQRAALADQRAAHPDDLDLQMQRLRRDYLPLRPGIPCRHFAVIDALQNRRSLAQQHGK